LATYPGFTEKVDDFPERGELHSQKVTEAPAEYIATQMATAMQMVTKTTATARGWKICS